MGIGLLTAVAGTCTLITLVVVGAHSDRTGERRGHVAAAAYVAAAGFVLSAWRGLPAISFLGMMIAQAAMMSCWGAFWSLSTGFLGGRAAAGGIALINAIANLGAFVGPNLVGWLAEEVHGYGPGLAALALTLVIGGTLALSVRHRTNGL